jgi:hypothetical protein
MNRIPALAACALGCILAAVAACSGAPPADDSPDYVDLKSAGKAPGTNEGNKSPSAAPTANRPSAASSNDGKSIGDAGAPGEGDGGGPALDPTDCGDKTDGWWCLGSGGYMAYCQGKQIAGGCGCAACTDGGTKAPTGCGGPPPPAACQE